MKIQVEPYLEESLVVKQAVLQDYEFKKNTKKAIRILIQSYKRGKKTLVAGNGGSAADAQHFPGEIVARFKRERRGYPMIALTTDSSVMTAWSNDYDFASVFARQVEALGKKGDVFIGISTSGDSENIIQAVKKAKSLGMTTVGMLGKGGGKLKNMCDVSIIVPSQNTPRIQEIHTLLVHIISEEIEKTFEVK